MSGDNGQTGQCTYDENITLASAYAGTRIQGYYNTETIATPPRMTGYLRVEANYVIFDGFEVSGPSVSFRQDT